MCVGFLKMVIVFILDLLLLEYLRRAILSVCKRPGTHNKWAWDTLTMFEATVCGREVVS